MIMKMMKARECWLIKIEMSIGVDLDEEAYFLDKDEFDDDCGSYDCFIFNDDDPKFIEITEKKTMKEATAIELQIVRGNVGNKIGEANVEGAVEDYQDFDNVDNPTDDNEKDDVNAGEKGKKKRERSTLNT